MIALETQRFLHMFEGSVHAFVDYRHLISGGGGLGSPCQVPGQLHIGHLGILLPTLIDEDKAVAIGAYPGQLHALFFAVFVAVVKPAAVFNLLNALDPAAQSG